MYATVRVSFSSYCRQSAYKVKFLAGYVISCNIVCMLFGHVAHNELLLSRPTSVAT